VNFEEIFEDYTMKEAKNSGFRIGIDLMGCDAQPTQIALAIAELLPSLPPSLDIVFLGTSTSLPALPHPRIHYFVAEEVITMDEDPLYAVRRKKNSSLYQGMQMLQRKEIDAFISAGNTGALIASANLALSRLRGVDRTALLTLLPTKGSQSVAVLDVGANPAAKAQHLLQYAAMGISFQKSCSIAHPTVGLLNIGEEAGKGTPEVREAYQQLSELNKDPSAPPVFIGNVEGRDVFNGHVDVIVTDGFTGNIFLKTAEGIASFILSQIEKTLVEHKTAHHLSDLLMGMRKRLHYAEYPGAIVCGVDGLVMKCHGDGNPAAFRESLKEAFRLLENGFLQKLKVAF
jgi:glycerol-3-phosphate acyltransferase PlsX